MDMARIIAERWSPRAYSTEPVSDANLKAIFEAGQASHSCFNEQPWRFLIATKKDGKAREQLERLLDEGNAYAKEPWILGLSFGKKTFTKTGKANRHAGHDVGSASAMMSNRAISLGVGMRFMAGYNVDEARKLAPADFEPYAMFVIGHPEKGLDRTPRVRNPLNEIIFEGAWGDPWTAPA